MVGWNQFWLPISKQCNGIVKRITIPNYKVYAILQHNGMAVGCWPANTDLNGIIVYNIFVNKGQGQGQYLSTVPDTNAEDN